MSFSDDVHPEREARGDDPLEAWPAFADAVRARLDAGRVAYGDRSFGADPATLLAELGQEALDLAGWGFVLWMRVERMRATLRRAEAVWNR